MSRDKIRAAVCVLMSGNKVLAIKRRYAPIGYALPGGMVERRERPKAAAVRELYEETGLRTEPSALVRLHVGRSDTGDLVASYLVDSWIGDPRQPPDSDEGPVSWISWGNLISGAFPEYNSAVYRAVLGELAL